MKSIRSSYVEQGVEKFYENNGNSYSNPHELVIQEHMNNLINLNHINNNNKILDLCCGSGEVSRFLLSKNVNNVEGCDPFTNQLYRQKTNKICHKYSFSELAHGKLKSKYNVIICSFAMHLCQESLMANLLFQLALNGKTLIIISPHKKPYIKHYWNLKEEHYFNKVRTRIFENNIFL